MDYPALIPFGRRFLAFAVLAALAGCQHGAPASEGDPAEQEADDSQPAEPDESDDSVDWEKAAQTPEVCDNEVDDDADGRVDCDDPECGPADGCEANWRTLSLGEGLGCALTESGGAWCWGEGEPRPERLDVEQVVEDIALRGRQGCAVIEDQVKCWARRYSQSWETTELRELVGSQGVEQISAGPMVLCAKAASEARCWGAFQELHPGPLITHYQDPSKFVQQEPRTHSFERELAEVTTGGYHACALDETGRAYCWGRNTYGQLGDSTTDDREQPVAVSTERRFRSLSAGMVHTCGVTTDDELLCWGGKKRRRDTSERSKSGAAVAAARPARAPGDERKPPYETQPEPKPVTTKTEYVAVSAGNSFSCAQTADGEVHCWGTDKAGAAGDGSTDSTGEPARIDAEGPFVQAAIGQGFACVLSETDEIRCWGNSRKAQIGDVHLKFKKREEAWSQWSEEFGVVDNVAAYFAEKCLLLENGDLVCVNRVGTMHGPSHRGSAKIGETRHLATAEHPVAGMAVSERHMCFWRRDGAARCVGDNGSGQLGTGAESLFSEEPAAVGEGLEIDQMAVSKGHSCAVTRGGEVHCWGDDRYGQAGGSDANVQWTPRRVDLDEEADQVTAGYAHSCALGASGRVWCWGRNDRGQLGDGGAAEQTAPVPIAGDLRFSQIVGIGRHTCGLGEEGEVYCWGDNGQSQVSSGNTASINEPVRVDVPAMTELAVGYEYSCAINDSGQIYCWGGLFGRYPHLAVEDDTLESISSTARELCMTATDGGLGCTTQPSAFEESHFTSQPVDVEF